MTRRQALAALASVATVQAREPDITLRISRTKIELAPGRIVETLTYNGTAPGPLLRVSEGRPVTVEVVNETADPEMVHWHGLHLPPQVDGAHEEGTPMVQARDRRSYTFTPNPAGTRWYHTHAMAGHNLNKGTYTGQFGMMIVEPATNPARYDQEVPLILHEWSPYFSADRMMDVDYKLFTINGKMLGAGEPLRVRQGQRILFRVLNASATMSHRLALPGHKFQVVALDGNPVPMPRAVPVLDLAPGERIDAIVAMTTPGIWMLAEEDPEQRNAGAGIVVEYAGATGKPRWSTPAPSAPTPFTWDYTAFGTTAESPKPALITPVIIEPRSDGNLWAVNGKSYPNTDPIPAQAGARNRLVFDNRSDMAHPFHLHRHTLEITRYAGRPTSGVFKDVIVVPPRQTVEVDFLANNPGPSLFHCHHQFHMDFGFMAVMQYD